jgi:vitamin B12 transporter
MLQGSRILLAFISAGCAAPSWCPAEPPVYTVMDEVVADARGEGRFLDTPGTVTTVFTASDIERMQARSLTELLETVASVRAVERGTPGSQADLSIRGSSAEGVLVLVDGIPFRDTQTGHFLMDLPVGLSDVERVEVLTGGGSALYGSSATGGIVNIVTRTRKATGAAVNGGSFGAAGGEGSFPLGGEGGSAVIGGSWSRSDGFRRGNDLSMTLLNCSGVLNTGKWAVRGNGGILKKEFGARDFYGPYPSEERVMTLQAGITANRTVGGRSMLRFKVGARGHSDDFILLRDDPSFYRNTHYNREFLAGVEYTSERPSFGTVTIGTEAERIGITSGSLGNHADGSFAVFGDCTRALGPGKAGVTLRYDREYLGKYIFSPGAGIEYPLSHAFRLHARMERSFRSPTYTERFYNDPSNHGDPGLRSERSTTAEAGIDRPIPPAAKLRGFQGGSVGAGVFGVRTTEVIDWVRESGETVWNAANHGRIETGGLECRASGSFSRGWSGSLYGTMMRRTVFRRAGTESKYALNTPERIVSAVLSGPAGAGISWTVSVRYEHMRSGSDRAPTALRIAKKYGVVTARISMENAANQRYEELPGLPVPGRRFTVELVK